MYKSNIDLRGYEFERERIAILLSNDIILVEQVLIQHECHQLT